MMIITEDIRAAIKTYLEDTGKSPSGFAVDNGWSNATVRRWLAGSTKTMRASQWATEIFQYAKYDLTLGFLCSRRWWCLPGTGYDKRKSQYCCHE